MIQFHAALFSCATVEAAAKSVGITPRTATRWLKSPEFKQAYIESYSGSPATMLSLSRATGLPALERLAKLIRSDETPATAAVAAARAVLDLMLQLTETRELEERIRSLEEIAGGQK